MKIRQICLVAAALLAAVTLFAQIPLVPDAPGPTFGGPAETQGQGRQRARYPVRSGAQLLQDAPEHVYGRRHRCRRKLQGAYLHSDLHGAERVCSNSTRTATTCGRLGRTSMATCIVMACASIPRTTSGWSTRASNTIIKFNPEGRVTMVLGRRPEYPVSGLDSRRKGSRIRLRRIFSIAKPTSPLTPPATSSWPTATSIHASSSTTRTAASSNRSAIADRSPAEFNLPHAIVVDNTGKCLRGQPQRPAHSWCSTTT